MLESHWDIDSLEKKRLKGIESTILFMKNMF